MTTRWFLLGLLGFLALSASGAQAQQSDSRADSKADDSRTPGRFFRKLREDFSGRKEDEDAKSKESDTRTAQRSPVAEGRESSGFQPLFSPPAFLGGQNAKRSETQQDPREDTPAPSRLPFKFSQPTLPPPVADTLPRPSSATSQRGVTGQRGATGERGPSQFPTPDRGQGSARQPAQQAEPTRPELGLPEPAPSNRRTDFASARTFKKPKPSIEAGFGFELVDRDEGLFIERIKTKGNADQAELKKGDQIVKIGGVEVQQKQQFAEIAEMLENGDQIELVFARRGKEEEVTLQFGQPPVAEEPAAVNDSPSQPESDLTAPGEIPDFAPPASGSSRYEPGVSELLGENPEVSSRQANNGFRSPSLPAPQDARQQTAEVQLQQIIRQQQEQIRQLQIQVQQLRQTQQRNQQPAPASQRGRR